MGSGICNEERVNVLSPTSQEFRGIKYYKCGFYFQRKGRRLHRVVWEHHRGSIPKGYHVHHADRDRSHNQIENLELLTAYSHLSLHGDPNARVSENARKLAAAWHGSDEGRKWHSEHWQRNIAPRMAERVTLSCKICGKDFEARRVFAGRTKFCSNNCKAKDLRKRRAADRAEKRLLPAD